MSVIEHLEPAWTRALLKRTRFVDPDFQGDTLAVISEQSRPLYKSFFSQHFISSYDRFFPTDWTSLAANHTSTAHRPVYAKISRI